MLPKRWSQGPSRLLGFFPDYSSDNNYQSMLYSESGKANWDVKSIENPFDVPLDFNAVHIHWQNAIWGLSHLGRSELVESDFSSLFDSINDESEKRRKTIWTVHNLLPHDSTDIDSELALMRKLSKESDVIHFLTKESITEVEKLITVDKTKIIVEPHSSYSGFLPNKLDSIVMRLKYGISKTSLIIGFIGQVRPYKNVESLIEVFLDLHNEFNDLVFIIAGLNQDQILDTKLKKLSQEYECILYINQFLTPIEFAEISSLIQIACYPYHSILNSGSVYSSLTFGHHIVVPNQSGLSSFKNKSFVTFYEGNSLVSLRNALQKVITNNLYLSSTTHALRFAKVNNASRMSRNFFKKLNGKLQD